MHSTTRHQQLTSLLTPLCDELQVTLWGIELALASPKHRVVRIFLDAPEGVTIDLCAAFSRQASVLLDVEDFIPGRYNLEVSSPGLDRTFFAPHQLDGFLGKEVKLTLNNPVQGRKHFRGTLVARHENTFVLRLETNDEHTFSWEETRKLNLIFTG